jgi:amidase
MLISTRGSLRAPVILPGMHSSPAAPGHNSVAGLQHALGSGALTASDLTDYYLDRIAQLNPALHAVIRVSPDAGDQARDSDAARAAGQPRGPLEGIPVLVKDNIQVAGMPATAGSPALLHAESGDAFCVTRLRAAGAVIIGKANMSEWANFRSTHSTSGWSTLGGQVDNPRAPGRNPSGSSSGSAAAVAAGLVPLAIGTETDGSIVCPASACGIVGIKPTLGLVSRSGIVPISLAQDTAGPMAASVADAAALLSVLAAVDPADPCGQADDDFPVRSSLNYQDYLDPGALDGARIGVWREACDTAGPAILAVLDDAVAVLREAGAAGLGDVTLPDIPQMGKMEFTALLHEFKRDINAYLAGLGGEHPADLAGLIAFNAEHCDTVLAHFGQEAFERAQALSGDPDDLELVTSRAEATRLARAAWDSALGGGELDAVIALTASPAWLTDYVLGDHDVFHTSSPAAVAGYPSVTVPAGEVSGLPVGLSFTGPRWSEPRLIALAHAFEQALAARRRGDQAAAQAR